MTEMNVCGLAEEAQMAEILIQFESHISKHFGKMELCSNMYVFF
jgi:hypothetical protein